MIRQFVFARLSNTKYSKIRREYKFAMLGIIYLFLTSPMTADEARKKLETLVAATFILAYGAGVGEGKADKKWVKEKIEKELVFLALLLSELWILKQTGVFDARLTADARAEGYAKGLDGVYNQGKVAGAGDKLLTFAGISGRAPEFPCKECDELLGRTMPASWWVDNGLIPGQPGNTNFTCQGWKCRHTLEDKNGEVFLWI